MREKFVATIPNLKKIRDFVSQCLASNNIDEKEIKKIELAVGEAAMNIVKHGYNGGDEKGEMDILVEMEQSSLRINFFDNGIPVIPKNIKPRDLKDIKPGGLGSFFISEIMDEVRWETKSKEWINHLVLTKHL